jgi:hypothetical protein
MASNWQLLEASNRLLSSGAGFFEQQRVMLVLVHAGFHGAWPCAAMCVAGRQHMLWY